MNTLLPINILVRGTNWVGDAVMSLPALSALARNYPGAKITVLTTPQAVGIYQNHPGVHQVLIHEKTGRHKGLAGNLRLVREIAGYKFDLAVLFKNSFSAALLAFMARIPERWGYAREARSLLLSKAVKNQPNDRHIHECFYYLNLLERLGLDSAYLPPHLCIPSEALAEAQAILLEAGIAKEDFILLLAPGVAGGVAKRWPQEKFAEAAALILKKRPGWIIILGSKEEISLGNKLCSMLPESCLNLVGRTSLGTVMALMSRSSLLLSNDSGLMHLGAAMGVPLVAAFGPTNLCTTAPLGFSRIISSLAPCAPCRHARKCSKTKICFDGVTPEKVSQAAIYLLEQSQNSLAAKPLIFIDPEGTIQEWGCSAPNAKGAFCLPGTAEAVLALTRMGYKIILACFSEDQTVQSAQDSGLFFLREHLLKAGADANAIHICSSRIEEVLQGTANLPENSPLYGKKAQELKQELARSIWVGADPNALAAAERYGASTILVLTRQGFLRIKKMKFRRHPTAPDLKRAGEWILALAENYE